MATGLYELQLEWNGFRVTVPGLKRLAAATEVLGAMTLMREKARLRLKRMEQTHQPLLLEELQADHLISLGMPLFRSTVGKKKQRYVTPSTPCLTTALIHRTRLCQVLVSNAGDSEISNCKAEMNELCNQQRKQFREHRELVSREILAQRAPAIEAPSTQVLQLQRTLVREQTKQVNSLQCLQEISSQLDQLRERMGDSVVDTCDGLEEQLTT
mmetsp:Transcript_18249/g.33070  ORF Transcript_18249/g.33070 Transcript_18249/m.33070 type:complete len:213 (-) Transcript_18249:19-657(-)